MQMTDLQAKKLENQKGFTLVEIAIVLVIIGLLLGGVLKGQELIENTKIKAVKSDSDSISTAIYGYQDRFRSFPGDDLRASNRNFVDAQGNAIVVTDGNGNGSLDTTAELGQVFAHIRAAGFMSGTGATAPTSAFGGTISVDTNSKGMIICQSGMNNEQMGAVDTRFDDGATNLITIGTAGGPDKVGTITYTLAVDADAAASPVEEGQPGVLCIQY